MEKSPAPRPAAGSQSEIHGVPVGGVATGYIEFGPDGGFRNVTINNNRFPETRIPWAENAFLAVRASTIGDPWTRVLQIATPSAFDAAGLDAQTLRRSELDWKPLFPAAHYTSEDTQAPISLDWQVFSPVLPYDAEAALLPAINFVLDAKNISSSSVRVSAMFNWENLRGRQREKTSSDRGTISAVAIDEVKKFVVVPAIDAAAKLVYAGLTFAHGSPHAHNEDADYTLLSVLPKGGALSMASWSPESPAETTELWRRFVDDGTLSNALSASSHAYCGACVQTIELAPGETQRFTFILTWYAPRYILNGEDIGNGYARRFRDSVDLAEYCAKHHAYFQRSVANWHDRFEQSSLPKWLSLMLINNNHVLTTNTIYTAEGKFALFESLDGPFAAPLDHALFVSLATLLFFPQFAHAELIRYLSGDAAETGDPHHHMGYGTPESPGRYSGESTRADLPAIIILLAYRNFLMTGNLPRLIEIYPLLKRVVARAIHLDKDKDGFPDADGFSTLFRGWYVSGLSSFAGGLWLTALAAFADLARRLDRPSDLERAEEMLHRCKEHFDTELWKETAGHFALYHDRSAKEVQSGALACHLGQLAGDWYAKFLAMPRTSYRASHSDHAAKRMADLLERDGAVRLGAMQDGGRCSNPPDSGCSPPSDKSWPNLAALLLGCPLVLSGEVEAGIRIMKSAFTLFHTDPSLLFNQPLEWDPAADAPSGAGVDHHAGPLGIWHALYAIEGFFLNVPDEEVHFRPNLPPGVSFLRAPIFTPVCLGNLVFKEDLGPPYQQRVEFSFESPVQIRKLNLRVPTHCNAITLSVRCDGDLRDATHALHPSPENNRLIIDLKETLLVQNSVVVTATCP